MKPSIRGEVCMQRGQRTNADDIELETTLQELALDLLGDTVYFVSVELF